ncbi:extracellular matrix-binding protein EbhA-like [Mytilus californianus]|uniref:extracellular matrix-binding protein EbhA-like n=1 Tax=Mytilus californianus TaxID=6549 RepID=UPI002245B92F|nr:extracellular matrix-binding protein EbhA-like [Mytilus californianus]
MDIWICLCYVSILLIQISHELPVRHDTRRATRRPFIERKPGNLEKILKSQNELNKRQIRPRVRSTRKLRFRNSIKNANGTLKEDINEMKSKKKELFPVSNGNVLLNGANNKNMKMFHRVSESSKTEGSTSPTVIKKAVKTVSDRGNSVSNAVTIVPKNNAVNTRSVSFRGSSVNNAVSKRGSSVNNAVSKRGSSINNAVPKRRSFVRKLRFRNSIKNANGTLKEDINEMKSKKKELFPVSNGNVLLNGANNKNMKMFHRVSESSKTEGSTSPTVIKKAVKTVSDRGNSVSNAVMIVPKNNAVNTRSVSFRGSSVNNAVSKRGSSVNNAVSKRGSSVNNAVSKRGSSVNNAVPKRRSFVNNAVSKRGSSVNNAVSKRRSSVNNAVKTRSVSFRGSSVNNTESKRSSSVNNAVSERGSFVKNKVSKRGNFVNNAVSKRGSFVNNAVLKRGSSVSNAVSNRGSSVNNAVLKRRSSINNAVSKRGSSK